MQIAWARGGYACVSSKEVQTVEDIVGRHRPSEFRLTMRCSSSMLTTRA